MRLERLQGLYAAYQRVEINQAIHPDDHMYNFGRDWYDSVGRAAVEAIVAPLAASWIDEIRTCLDFGCGHGRVARHLRAFLPDTKLYFCDVEGADFCAEQFGGEVVSAAGDIANADLPGDVDLIWVGSVFTHLNYARMQALAEKLLGRLSRNGLLVATFAGRGAIRHLQDAPPIPLPRWTALLADYEAHGVGHADYEGTTGWGTGLITPGRIWELGKDARLVHFAEAGWAGRQDVAAWTRS
jgi:SAM-dependent methyltransferase